MAGTSQHMAFLHKDLAPTMWKYAPKTKDCILVMVGESQSVTKKGETEKERQRDAMWFP